MAMYTLQGGKGVMADYDANGVDDFMQGLDFNTISSNWTHQAQPPSSPMKPPRQLLRPAWPSGLKLQVVATWRAIPWETASGSCPRPRDGHPTGYSNAIYFAPFAWGGAPTAPTRSTVHG